MVELDWDFYQKQEETIQYASSGEYDITVFLGGYRSGKSVTGSRWLLEKALENPGGNFLMMAVDYSKGKKTTYEVFFEEALPGKNTNPFKGGDPENSELVANWTKQDRALVLKNGSTITPAGADEEGRYEGGSFNAVWMDEPGLYKDKLDGVTSTILERMDGGDPGTIMWTTTGKKGALQRIIEKRRWEDESKVDNPMKVVKVSTEENPFLDDRSLQRLKDRYEGGSNEEMALHGKFGDVEGRVYPQFGRESHVISEEEARQRIDSDKKYLYGYDAGWDDKRVVLEVGQASDGTLIVLNEFYESESFVSDAINWVKDRPKGKIVSEHEPEHQERFRKHTRHKVVDANKSIEPGIENVQYRFKKQGVLVADSCPNLIEELLQYQKEDVGGTNVADHACDSLRYIIQHVDSVEEQKNTGIMTAA